MLVLDQSSDDQLGLLSWIVERLRCEQPASELDRTDQIRWLVLHKLELERAEGLLRWLKRRLAEGRSIDPRA
jgi:hypothetical protein